MARRLGKIAEYIMTLLFPERCVICDNTIWESDEGLCPLCSDRIVYNHEPRCKLCGKQLTDSTAEYCLDCMKRDHNFDGGYSLCIYNDAVRKSLYRLKYKNRRRYAIFYGHMMAKRLGRIIRELSPDALIPVPIHKKRLRKRGFNQAKELARALSKETGIPVMSNLVIRTKNTKALKLLDSSMRQNNLKNAFKICADVVKLKTTVIVDDIYTTGSTVDEMAAVLKAAGVKKVYFITVAAGGSH